MGHDETMEAEFAGGPPPAPEKKWKRRALKRCARQSLRKSYWRMLIVCALMAVFAGGQSFSTLLADGGDALQSVNFRLASNTEVVNDFVRSVLDEQQLVVGAARLSTASKGILAGVINNITVTGNPLFGTLNAINQLFFRDRIGAGIVILVGVLAMLAYRVFIGNTLRVGEYRFFMECRRYPATRVGRMLYLYKIRRMRDAAVVMLLRDVYTTLWMLTIVGGAIKWYSYRMIPYILAENPAIPRKKAFKLSEAMMRGYKWRAFMLDASFTGWYALSLLTFGIFGVAFMYPYKNATDAELYMELRSRLLARHPGTRRYFNDLYLAAAPAGDDCGQYPLELYPLDEHPSRHWLGADYRRKYSLQNIVLIFFTFCIMGWVWEVFVDLMNKGVFVNRGTMYGPWLPIYGVGGVLMILLLRRFAERPAVTFLLAMLLCGVMEYVTSWVLETFMGQKWWDYSGYFMSINGRVCLEGLLIFGLGGCLGIYIMGPALDELFNKIPKKIKTGVVVGLCCLFAVDLGISALHPNMAAVEAGG